MKKLRKFKDKIMDNIIIKILRWIVYVVVAILLIIIVVQKVTNNNLSVGGFRVFMIVSESMKGEYDIGDILILKSVDADEINVGDNVTYLGEKSGMKGLIITHKVVEKKEENGEVFFTTRGIANDVEDPVIRYDQIYGKVVYKTVILSLIAKLMNNQVSYYILFTVVALIISIEIASSLVDSKYDSEEEDDRRE